MGYCSRRKADDYIEKGMVSINGKKAVLGQKIEKTDNVEVSKKIKKLPASYEYYLFNKPVGIVSHDPQENEEGVADVFKTQSKVDPIGRLDKLSQGLMFLTNDGRIVNKMLSPEFGHEKEYQIWVDKDLTDSFKRKMQSGVSIEGYMTKPAKFKQTGPKSFRLILTEGKKHQIRRMAMALGFQVKKLRRIRIMNLKLGTLPAGKGRPLSIEEKMELMESLK